MTETDLSALLFAFKFFKNETERDTVRRVE